MFDHCLYFNTTALARQLEREWAVAFSPFDLTAPQAFMLRAVLQRPGLLQHELAVALVIARPTATRALDKLALKGLIERHASERDGRESAVHPSAYALTLRTALDSASAEVTNRLKKRLGLIEFASTVAQVQAVRALLD